MCLLFIYIHAAFKIIVENLLYIWKVVPYSVYPYKQSNVKKKLLMEAAKLSLNLLFLLLIRAWAIINITSNLKNLRRVEAVEFISLS
jgi:hypothetical protein